ncbi:MAG: diversity-generating retroelement protein Avd [Gammaproteobacteria bacterium]|nr:diversity-generating retroelement protein Avd [Gammaproteobacteria bacterium]
MPLLNGGGGQGPTASQPDRARTTGAALEAHYRFLLWLVPAVERFPRRQKFLLGDRIQMTALDVLERLIEVTYTKRRGDLLARANLGLEKLRFLFRLAHDLHLLDMRRYRHAARSIDDTGRKVGAWRKAHHAQA